MVVIGQRHGLGASPRERALVPIKLETDWAPQPVWTFRIGEKSQHSIISAVAADILYNYKKLYQD
jgi:hypothetical protein